MVLSFFFSLQGKLLYCIAPPGLDEAEFQQIGYKLQNLADVETKDREARERARKQVVFLFQFIPIWSKNIFAAFCVIVIVL